MAGRQVMIYKDYVEYPILRTKKGKRWPSFFISMSISYYLREFELPLVRLDDCSLFELPLLDDLPEDRCELEFPLDCLVFELCEDR